MSELIIVSGRSNSPLAEKIARSLGEELSPVTITNFSDGEIWVKYEENIRGKDVFIVQPTNPPAENFLELLIMIDATFLNGSSNFCLGPIMLWGTNITNSIP